MVEFQRLINYLVADLTSEFVSRLAEMKRVSSLVFKLVFNNIILKSYNLVLVGV